MRTPELNTINLTTLPLGEHRFEFTLDDSFLSAQQGELLGGLVSANVTLNLRTDDYDLHFALEGEVRITCDRCLEPMTLPISLEETLFSPDEQGDDLDENRMLDLAWYAYETIMVHLPLVHSHQPGGCNPTMAALLQDHLCTSDSPEDDDI